MNQNTNKHNGTEERGEREREEHKAGLLNIRYSLHMDEFGIH
jgi:hypothetical protein